MLNETQPAACTTLNDDNVNVINNRDQGVGCTCVGGDNPMTNVSIGRGCRFRHTVGCSRNEKRAASRLGHHHRHLESIGGNVPRPRNVYDSRVACGC